MISITDLKDPRLDLILKTTETELAHYYEPRTGLFLAESMKLLERSLRGGYEPVCLLAEDRYLSEVERLLQNYSPIIASEVPVYAAPYEILKDLVGYPMTGGVLCVMKRKPLPDVTELCRNATRIAVLENVVNPTNVGAIFRNAAALGIDAVLLSPGCSDPLYKRASRVSMGTVFQIPWTFLTDWPTKDMKLLSDMGFVHIAMALDERAIEIRDPKLHTEKKRSILLGSEGYGLTDQTLALCDYTVMIPMSHEVDSLNVAAASALAFWELGNCTEQ